MPDTNLEVLRGATRALHEQLDGSRLARSLTRSPVSPDNYARFLWVSRGIHAAFADSLRNFANQNTACGVALDRLRAIDDDIASFRISFEWEPYSPQPMPPQSSAEQWGMAYVLEGSQLGGQVLAKKIRESFGAEGPSVKFLSGRGPSTFGEWKKFCEKLDSQKFSVTEVNAMSRYAIYLFGLFIMGFGRAEGLPAR